MRSQHYCGFENYLTFVPRPGHDEDPFAACLFDVFWDLVDERLLRPGHKLGTPAFPWFHLTPFGRKVLEAGEYVPHDKGGYLLRLQQRVKPVDPTVLAYLEESLDTYAKGNLVASTVMLGVAAERVFLLLCESIGAALADPKDKVQFEKLLGRQVMRPKLGWVDRKFQLWEKGKTKVPNFPDDATLMVTAISNLARVQRNDLGHPQEQPPRLDRGNAYANLVIFPNYYETAERIRTVLKTAQV